MDLSRTTTSKPTQGRANLSGGNHAPFSDQLLEKARVNVDTALKDLESRLSGLSTAEVEARIKRDGLNEIGREKRPSPLMRLWDNVKNPLVILLTALGVLSYLTRATGGRRSSFS
jgi:Mg2+-importing ATPase